MYRVVGDPRLDDLSSCSAKFPPSRAGVFRFFDRTTDRFRWGFDTPRMPTVAIMGGWHGRLCWTCGSSRTRKVEIEGDEIDARKPGVFTSSTG